MGYILLSREGKFQKPVGTSNIPGDRDGPEKKHSQAPTGLRSEGLGRTNLALSSESPRAPHASGISSGSWITNCGIISIFSALEHGAGR